MTYPAKHRYQNASTAEDYDRRFRGPGRALMNWLDLRAFRRGLRCLKPGSHVLDVACGTGRLAELALRLGHYVTGVDISHEMLTVAAGRLGIYPTLNDLRVEDAEHLSFPDGAFDCVMTARFLVHVPGPVRCRVIAELSRVSSGWVVVEHPVRSPVAMARRRLAGAVRQASQQQAAMVMHDSWETFHKRVAEAGLRVVEVVPKVPLGLVNSRIVVLAKRTGRVRRA